MAFTTVKKDEQSVKDGGNSKFINASGIYPVTLLAPFVDVNEKGSVVVNLAVDFEGQTQAIYGNMRITNNGGATNEIGAALFNKLCVVCGIEGDVEDPIEGILPIGKKGADKEVAVLEDLSDKEILVRVQQEYSINPGKGIRESQVLKAFYTADGASAAELVNESEVGVQLAKDQDYASNVTYRDGLDAEQVATWIAGGRKAGGSTGGAKPAGKPSFAKKSFGKK